ncbi:MAG TPA: type I-U CRISPR-associated protein Csb2 [Solirubrobacter sp.]|nr:type I-U CRISPR-associated protein Csb2 [Solirubrobacter sp.]
MVGLAASFDLGRVHATPWGTHVNEAVIEWPPSPWRLLRALLAASYAHAELIAEQPMLREALRVLIAAPPPRFVVPASASGHTRHYYPVAGKTSLIVDAFLAVKPADELEVLWDAELAPDERRVLARAAEAVGYLGRSESVCALRVIDALSHEANAVPAVDDPEWAADASSVELWSYIDDVDRLDTSIAELRRARRLVPEGVRPVRYLVRTAPPSQARLQADEPRPTLAHLRIRGGGRPPLIAAIDVARVLRAALQRRFDDVVGGGASPVFSGHAVDGSVRSDQHQHAHYLVGSDRDAKRADHLWVWAPAGFGDDELAAIAALRTLRFRDEPEPCRVGLVALGDVNTLHLPRLVGPASTWRSATPFVLPRHQKRRGGRLIETPEEQIVRELAHRGFPSPTEIELSPGPWAAFKTTRPGVSRRLASRVVGAVLRFPEPVHGPIAIGAQSHFGLGRFEPVP